MNMNQYRKAIVAAIAAVVIVLNEAFGAAIGLGEVEEVITIGTALLGVLGVERVRNEEA